MADTVERARALIEARLGELETEAKELQRAVASLGGSAATRKRRSPKRRSGKSTAAPSRASAARRRSARAPRGRRREQLLAALKANPGARPADLAREIGISANQTHSLLARARADKLLVKKGRGYALKS